MSTSSVGSTPTVLRKHERDNSGPSVARYEPATKKLAFEYSFGTTRLVKPFTFSPGTSEQATPKKSPARRISKLENSPGQSDTSSRIHRTSQRQLLNRQLFDPMELCVTSQQPPAPRSTFSTRRQIKTVSAAPAELFLPDESAFSDRTKSIFLGKTHPELQAARNKRAGIIPPLKEEMPDTPEIPMDQKFAKSPFTQNSIAFRKSLDDAVANGTPLEYVKPSGKQILLSNIRPLHSGQHTDAFLCTIQGSKTQFVLKVFKKTTLERRSDDALKFIANQLYHYALNMKSDSLRPYIAFHLNYNPFLEHLAPFLAIKNAQTREWALKNFVARHPSLCAIIVEHVPEEFPLDFNPKTLPWRQLQFFYRESLKRDIPNDTRRSNVGIGTDGNMKLYDMFEHIEEHPRTLLDEHLATFTDVEKEQQWLDPRIVK